MRWIRLLGVLATSVMLATVAYGLASGGFSEEGSTILGLPWGRVTIVDLYVGLVIFAAWVAIRETRWTARIVWWLALATLGNLASAVYLTAASFRSADIGQLLRGSRHG